MLADELDYVLGVGTHRHEHVTAPAGAVVAGGSAPANAGGYRELHRVAERQAPGRRAWAIEGTGSYGAGLARFLSEHGEPCSRSAERYEPSDDWLGRRLARRRPHRAGGAGQRDARAASRG